MNNKAQMNYTANLVMGLVGFLVAITVFFIASPFLKTFIIAGRENTGVLSGFLITIIPFVVLLLLIMFLVSVFRGGSAQ